jgi:predicted membrane-bound mannosyltransferase
VEGWHAWRQADAAAIAQNFYDNGFDLFHPQINHGGDTPGYTDTEFPIYPYTVALLWKVFGVHDGWGRFVSVICSLLTIYFLYLLIKKYVGETEALWSTLVYAILPLNIYYARTFMPTASVLCCTVVGLYFFSEWLDNRKQRTFILSAVSLSLAALMNPTALIIGLPMTYLSYVKLGRHWHRTASLWMLAMIAILPAVGWYSYSHAVLYSPGYSIGVWDFATDKWGNFDLIISPKFYNDIFFKSIAERHLTYAATIPFLVGLFLKRQSREEKVFDWWLIAVIIYFLIVAKGNDVHEYYQLPFIVPAVAYIGKTFSKYLTLRPENASPAFSRWRVFLSFCCIAIVPLSFLRYSESFAARERPNSPLTRLAQEVETLTNPRDLIIVASEGEPTLLYRSHRKGWVVAPWALDSTYIVEKQRHGAKYLTGIKNIFENNDGSNQLNVLLQRFPIVKNTDDYFLLNLNSE